MSFPGGLVNDGEFPLNERILGKLLRRSFANFQIVTNNYSADTILEQEIRDYLQYHYETDDITIIPWRYSITIRNEESSYSLTITRIAWVMDLDYTFKGKDRVADDASIEFSVGTANDFVFSIIKTVHQIRNNEIPSYIERHFVQ